MRHFDERQLRFDERIFGEGFELEGEALSAEEARLISEAARQAFEGGELPSWYGDYLRLRELGWPWRVACYIAWAASPKSGRRPKTLAELATGVLGLSSPRAVHKWREKYPTLDEVVAMMQAAPLWDHRRDVLEALVEMAKRPDYKSHHDRKLFLELVGDYTPKSKVEVGRAKGDLSELSDAELEALLGDGGPAEMDFVEGGDG